MPTSTAVVNRDIRPFDEEEVKRAIERAKANKSPQLSWIEQVPSKHQAVGSNPTGDAKTKEGNTQRAGLDGIACAVS